jgi:type I restriction enzyme, S subunit
MWKTVKLGDACLVRRGTSITKKQTIEGNVPVIGGGTKPTYFHNKQNRVANCITVSGSGASAGLVSKWEVPIFASDCSTVEPKDETQLHQFVYYYLMSQQQFIYDNFRSGAAQPHVYARDLETLDYPIIPLAEQKRIAAILDKADAIRKKRKQAIELADQFLRSVFLDMFGDPVTNPKKWMTMNIEQMAESKKGSIKRGPFGGALKKEIFVDSGYLVYEQYHALNNDFSFGRYFINEAKFQELKAFEVRPRDIIISCSGVNLGKLAEVPVGAKPGIINQALLKITLNSDLMLNPMFIQIFSHPNFKRAFYGDFRGAAIPNFPPMNTFKEFRFIVPPLEAPNDYLAIVRKIQEWKLNMQNSANRSVDLFSVLGKRVFT